MSAEIPSDPLFDDLARQLAAGLSRRHALRALGRAAFAAVAATLGFQKTVDAQSCFTPCKKQCTLGNGALDFTCFRQCVNSDPNNCGRCDNVCTPGLVCLNGVCSTPPIDCTTDVPTLASLDEARAQLGDGIGEVNLSPKGCVRFRRQLTAGVLLEEIIANGVVTLSSVESAQGLTLHVDGDADGFFEFRRTGQRNAIGSPSSALYERYWPTTRQLQERATYQLLGSELFIALEQRNEQGHVVKATTAIAPAPPPSSPATMLSAAATVDSSCPAGTRADIATTLGNAFDIAIKCMQRHRVPAVSGTTTCTTILTYLYNNGTTVKCDPSIGPRAVYEDVWELFAEAYERQGQITLRNPSTSSTDRQLFVHELLHSCLPEHDLARAEWGNSAANAPAYSETERVEACASMCVNEATGSPLTSKCQCARCLGTSTCSSECAGFSAVGNGGCERICQEFQDCGAFKCGACETCRNNNGACKPCDPCSERCDATGTCIANATAAPASRTCGSVCCTGPCDADGTGCCPEPRICGEQCCTPDQTCVTRSDGTKFCCQSGWECQCPVGPNAHRVFPTRTECEVTCPTGLGCFGFTECKPVSCPPFA